ncbi:MAG: membrane protein insertion efficiency factor YidD [Bacteroidota bacterium]|jgi:putative membrane protein insertion efficiency factor
MSHFGLFFFVFLINSLLVHVCPGQDINQKPIANSFKQDIQVYQKFLSPTLGTNCRMHPTCSNFAIASFQQKPQLAGFFKTADRLIRCGNDDGEYRIAVLNDVPRLLDPVLDTSVQLRKVFFYSWIDSVCSGLPFICHLLQVQLYDEAILEIHRERFKNTDIVNNRQLQLTLLEAYCYLSKGEKDKVIQLCSAYLKYTWNSHLAEILADAYTNSNHSALAATVYKSILDSIGSSSPSSIYKKLVYNMSVLEEWSTAWDYLKKSPDSNFEIITSVNKCATTKYKSPTKAALFGIIPGMGYLYAGQSQSALTAFCFNGLVLFASYDLIKNRQYGMGVLMSAMSMSFYIGNIYGGARSVKKLNVYRKSQLLKPIESWSFGH